MNEFDWPPNVFEDWPPNVLDCWTPRPLPEALPKSTWKRSKPQQSGEAAS